jgi:exopolysaccharide production protein ExoZ
MQAYQSNKINSLQVYRGVAAILVVLFHITNYSRENLNYNFLGGMFSFGYVGVDFFFVLSGFIILYNHAKDLGKRQSISRYATKRLIRIYPIYWMITVTKLIAIIIIPSIAKPHEQELSTILNSLLLFPQINLPIIGAAWTLSYEMLFYVLFGFAILFGWRWGLSLAGIWSVAMLGYALRGFIGISVPDHYLITFFLNERNLEFIFGCVSAYIVANCKLKHSIPVALTGGILFVLAGQFIMKAGNVISYTLLFGIPSLLLVTGSASLELEKAISLPKFLILLGDASYSIYLTHAMFVNIFSLVIGRSTVLGPFFITLAITVGAILGGTAVHLFLERPLLSILRTWTIQKRKQARPAVI